jgi:hypothetical protein
MYRNKKKTIWFILLSALLMAALTSGSAFASEGNEIEVEGTIVAMDPDESTLDLEVEGEILVVKVAGNFDFESVAIGDLIEVKGTLNDDGTLVLSEYKIQERVRDRVELQDGEKNASFCIKEDKIHPVAERIADTYDSSYEDILGWLCGGEDHHAGLGQVMLALQTASLTGGSFDTYLTDRESGMGWGKIWQDLELKGKPGKETPPGQVKKGDGEVDLDAKIPPGQMKKNNKDIECTEELEQLGLCKLESNNGKSKGKNK